MSEGGTGNDGHRRGSGQPGPANRQHQNPRAHDGGPVTVRWKVTGPPSCFV